jgi:hypothetical protein
LTASGFIPALIVGLLFPEGSFGDFISQALPVVG